MNGDQLSVLEIRSILQFARIESIGMEYGVKIAKPVLKRLNYGQTHGFLPIACSRDAAKYRIFDSSIRRKVAEIGTTGITLS